MAFIVADRVRETSASIGTGDFNLVGAIVGYQSFSSAIGNGNTTYYAISNPGVNEWEVGIGTVNAGTLTRNTVLASSTGTSLVSFTVGSKDVFCTYPSEAAVFAGNAVTLTNKTINLGSNTLVATSAQLASAVSDETGSGSLVFANSPTLTSPTLNTSAVVNYGTANQVQFLNGSKQLVGDADLTFDGTTLSTTNFTSSGNITLSGGTANGVAYLNGSKVLTTGSALAFNGSTLNLNNALNVIGSNFANITFTGSSVNTSGVYTGLDSGGGYVINVRDNGYQAWSTNNTEQMRLTLTGLGIGTSSPSVKLDVSGAIRTGGGADPGSGAVFFQNNSSGSYPATIAGLNIAFNTGANDARTTKMFLDTSGNLGLGVTPSAWYSLFKTIDIGQGTSLTGQTNTPSTILATNTFWNSGATPIYKSTAAASYYASYGGQHLWYTAPSGTAGNAISFTQAMTLDASGNLGIGTSSPLTKFQVKTNTDQNFTVSPGYLVSTASMLQAQNDSGGSLIPMELRASQISFDTGNTERMRIDSSGNLLVGTTSNSAVSSKLYVSGSNFMVSINGTNTTGEAVRFYSNGSTAGTISYTATTVAYNTSSDYRLKENIQPMQNALDVVAQLNPVRYTWKADGSDGQGFIAHELQAVVPNCVTGEKDAVDAEGNPVYQGIDTSFLVATLTKAIQEQQEQINQLTARVAQLEGN